jgi:hypothetical protein
MERKKSGSAARFWRWQLCVVAIVAFLALPDQVARADEGGVSFWLPGQFGSLAAVPVAPGWSLGGSLLSHDGTSVGRCGGGKRDRDRQIPCYRQRQFECNSERASRSFVAGADLHFCDARAWWAIGHGCDRAIREEQCQYRRDADRRVRADSGHSYGNHFRFDYLGRRSLSHDHAEMA